MSILGLFVLPVLAWIGIAATFRTLPPRTKPTTVQFVCLLIFGFAYAASNIALAGAITFSPLLLLAGLVESVTIFGLVYLQFRARKISEGPNKDSPST